jgi:hypothetical protein
MKKSLVWLGVIVAFILVWVGSLFIFKAPPSRRQAAAPAERQGSLEPSTHTERHMIPAESAMPRATPESSPVVIDRSAVTLPVTVQEKEAPLRMYTATGPVQADGTPKPEATPEEEPLPDAPSWRLVRCILVGGLDSSNITTPIHGQVEENLMWNGKVIIPRCSEVHGTAQIDKARERIAGEGAFTFILRNPEGNGWLDGELVVKGLALDREYGKEFNTWAIMDETAGIRGTVIPVDKLADLKLLTATMISGGSAALESTSTSFFGGQTATTNGRGAGGVAGVVINPVTQGVQAVLNQYAQRIMNAIERDGFFIRVPPSKQFYVKIAEPIYLSKMTPRGESARRKVQSEFLQERKQLEEVTQPRSVRDAWADQAAAGGSPGGPGLSQLDQANAQMRETNQLLNARRQELQTQSDQLKATSQSQIVP